MSKSIHDLRVFNFAIIDIVGTIFISYVISRYTIRYGFKFPVVLGILLLLGIILHYLMGIPTTLNNILGLSGPSLRTTSNAVFSVYHPTRQQSF